MRKVVNVPLTALGISRAIGEVERTKREILRRTEQLVQRLTEEGTEIARVRITELDAIYTGDLLASIEGFYDPQSHVGIVRANSPYAFYVEYGTGIVGAGSPHPEPDGWVYDINGHGQEGWVYFNGNDQKFHLTRGMRARPFMYNTLERLSDDCMRIAREVFGA